MGVDFFDALVSISSLDELERDYGIIWPVLNEQKAIGSEAVAAIQKQFPYKVEHDCEHVNQLEEWCRKHSSGLFLIDWRDAHFMIDKDRLHFVLKWL